ncbi:MAG: ribonuclease III, partial [Parachlamydiaceae bacterium]
YSDIFIFHKKKQPCKLIVMNKIDEISTNIALIETKIGYCFHNKQLLMLAFTHCSYVNENRATTEHNERLEFLGDSILGLIISEYLYRTLPNIPEGELSAFRAKLVESTSCISYVQKLDLEPYLMLGRGERMNDGRGRETILSDLFEAIIGAIFLDGGIEAAQRFFFENFNEEVNHILQEPLKNPKAALQDYCQKKFQKTPHYVVLSESGPDHSKIFKMIVKIQETELGQGEGPSKKEAQQAAAKNALELLHKEL